jgi:hypothetical protein
MTRPMARSLIVSIGLLAGLGIPDISVGESGTPMGTGSYAQTSASNGTAVKEVDEARWLAIRYAAEAEHHFFQAIRYEERAVQVDPVKDSLGTSRNKLLSEADVHWAQMFDLRARAQLFYVQASQRTVR